VTARPHGLHPDGRARDERIDMVSGIQHIIRKADAAVARTYLAMFDERSALMPFLFHSLFRDEREAGLDHVDPLQRTTVAQFRQFVEYYLRHGYQFVDPGQILAGLKPGGKYAVVTFDDGYFNNTLALPVLEEFGVPAVFFVASDNVRLGKCYWWDVLHRELVARGATARQVYREGLALKAMPTETIEAELARRFGPRAFDPRGDVDRPFTPDELRDFARHPRVRIGNHTANHAILTNYSAAEARGQVARAQEWLAGVTGAAPVAIAYPNGGHDAAVVRACREVGLGLGFTVRPEKTSLPLGDDPDRRLRIGRFTPHGDDRMLTQCRTYRSDVLLYGTFRAGYLRLVRGKAAQ
jgi:peptidoglycan/xylan/chitin deacetylase (PgdA/CDA1 family)